MPKNNSTQTQTSTHAYMPHPGSPEIDALKGMKAQVNTSIPYLGAVRRERLNSSYANPLGAATSPAVRDAAMRGMSDRLAMDESAQLQQSQFQADETNRGLQTTIAAMTDPKLVQTGGTAKASSGQNAFGTIFGMLT